MYSRKHNFGVENFFHTVPANIPQNVIEVSFFSFFLGYSARIIMYTYEEKIEIPFKVLMILTVQNIRRKIELTV